MRTGNMWRLHRSVALVLVAIMVASLGGAVLACDHDNPIQPDWVTGAVSVHFGTETGQTSDIARSIDAREAIEPQLTAMLMTGDVNDSPRGTMVAGAEPALRTWISELERTVTLVSETAMRALGCYF